MTHSPRRWRTKALRTRAIASSTPTAPRIASRDRTGTSVTAWDDARRAQPASAARTRHPGRLARGGSGRDRGRGAVLARPRAAFGTPGTALRMGPDGALGGHRSGAPDRGLAEIA